MSIKRKNRNPREATLSTQLSARRPNADLGVSVGGLFRDAPTSGAEADVCESAGGAVGGGTRNEEGVPSDRFEAVLRGQLHATNGESAAAPARASEVLRPRHAQALTSDQADAGWLDTLRSICRDCPEPEGPLRVLPGATFGGVNQKFILTDAAGRRFFWKAARPRSFGIERSLLANTLRAQAGEAALPLSVQSLELGDRSYQGLCSPYLENDGNLDYDFLRFGASEKNAVLADMPWAYVLGNWDTKPDQYLRLSGTALNIDWDLCLSDFAAPTSTYSRHSHPHFVSVARPVQSALLLGYVRGQVEVDLNQMRASAKRIAGLSDSDLHAALEPFIAHVYRQEDSALPGLPEGNDVLDAIRVRRDGIVEETERLLFDLEAERDRIAQPMSMVDIRLLPNALADVEMSAAIMAARSPLLSWVYAAGQWFSALQMQGTPVQKNVSHGTKEPA